MMNSPTLPALVEHAAVAIQVTKKTDQKTGLIRREIHARLAYPQTRPDYELIDGRLSQRANEPVESLKHRLNGEPHKEIIWHSQWIAASRARLLFEEIQQHTQYAQNQSNTDLISYANAKAEEVRHINL